MSIQYSGGTYVNTTFQTSSKADIVSNLQTQLTAAGWAVISGAGTTNLLLQTAQDAAGNQGRVRLIDNGGTGIQVILENVSGSAKQQQAINHGGTLRPPATYRLLATRYQFFVFPSAGTAAGGQFVCAGLVFIPAFLHGTITEAFYMASNSLNDSDGSNPPAASLRTAPNQLASMNSGNPGNHAMIVNGNLYDHSNDGQQRLGDLALIVPGNSYASNYGSGAASPFIPAYRWHDLSLQIAEILMAWGNTSYNDEPLLRGQMYDACFISDVFAQNAATSFADSGAAHNFFCLSSSQGTDRLTHGSLFVATS